MTQRFGESMSVSRIAPTDYIIVYGRKMIQEDSAGCRVWHLAGVFPFFPKHFC